MSETIPPTKQVDTTITPLQLPTSSHRQVIDTSAPAVAAIPVQTQGKQGEASRSTRDHHRSEHKDSHHSHRDDHRVKDDRKTSHRRSRSRSHSHQHHSNRDIKKSSGGQSTVKDERDHSSRHRSKRSRSKDHRRRSSRRHSRDRRGGDEHRRDRDRRHRRHGKHHRKHSSSSSADRSSSSSSSGGSSSSSRSSSAERRKKTTANRRGGGRDGRSAAANQDVHPYFQKRKADAAAAAGRVDPTIADLQSGDATQRFWDGFQWIIRTNDQIKAAHQNVSDINQSAVESATKTVTGEDAVAKEKRLAASKTVIIEGLALDLGITARELQKYILEQAKLHTSERLEIADIDMNNGPTSIAVELAERNMVETLKELDGKITLLGQTLHIRRLNEETVQTNIQSAAIALAAMQEMIGKGEGQINLKTGSLRTVAPSCVIKVSNVFEREEELTPELYEELKEDMEDEFGKIPHLKRIRIVRNGEERLGAEVGCVFVEFRDKKSAECALKKIKGRIYDGREIQVTYIEEKLYYKELCLE